MSGKIPATHVRLKRAYEPPTADDGTRILVDRLWPRAVKKTEAAIDEWMKEIAPSTALRKWFGHDSARWPEFQRRYKSEVREHPTSWNDCGRFPNTAASRSSSPPTTRRTTTRW